MITGARFHHAGNCRTIVCADPAALAQLAAERMAAVLDTAARPAAVCLTGGSSPKRLYDLLATPAWGVRIDFDKIEWFVGDERFVPEHDPLSNIGMAQHAFLQHCAAPSSVHPVATQSASPEVAADRYAAELDALQQRRGSRPLFDIVLLGLGGDGHVASLFPGQPTVSETQRQVVGVPQAGLEPFVPRVSLTLPTLARTRLMMMLVTGAEKRDILRRVRAGEDLPAARLSCEGELLWLVDRAAYGDDA